MGADQQWEANLEYVYGGQNGRPIWNMYMTDRMGADQLWEAN